MVYFTFIWYIFILIWYKIYFTYSKNHKNLINQTILNKLSQFNQLNHLNDLNKISIPINEISCSIDATKSSSITSNEIEGITINNHQSKQQNLNAQTLINNYNEILSYIKQYAPEINFTKNEILHWYKKLFENTLQQTSIRGKFKNTQNYVVNQNNEILFKGASIFETPSLVAELIDWYISSDLPPLIKIIVFNADFLMIHPFSDGNGRLSRLIMNYLLIKEGYTYFKYVSLEQVILNHKGTYLKLLKTLNHNWDLNDSDYSQNINWFLDIFIITLNKYDDLTNLNHLYTNKLINKEGLICLVIDYLANNKQIISKQNIINYLNQINLNISEVLIKQTLNYLAKNDLLILKAYGRSSTWLINEAKWSLFKSKLLIDKKLSKS